MTFIELLVATLLMVMALMGLMSLWVVAFSFTAQSSDTGAGYNLGRLEVERMKDIGFFYATDGTQTRFFKQTSAGVTEVASAAGADFQVTTSVTTGHLTGNSDASFQRAASASDQEMRRVRVTVTALHPQEVVFDTVTYLSRGGR
jgi:Tfp pilus assembly protein PilV